MGFNPRARTGRDDGRKRFIMTIQVSIHAPARGATTPAQNPLTSRCFNPRARTGRDYEQEQSEKAARVSIHAPARGATLPS